MFNQKSNLVLLVVLFFVSMNCLYGVIRIELNNQSDYTVSIDFGRDVASGWTVPGATSSFYAYEDSGAENSEFKMIVALKEKDSNEHKTVIYDNPLRGNISYIRPIIFNDPRLKGKSIKITFNHKPNSESPEIIVSSLK